MYLYHINWISFQIKYIFMYLLLLYVSFHSPISCRLRNVPKKQLETTPEPWNRVTLQAITCFIIGPSRGVAPAPKCCQCKFHCVIFAFAFHIRVSRIPVPDPRGWSWSCMQGLKVHGCMRWQKPGWQTGIKCHKVTRSAHKLQLQQQQNCEMYQFLAVVFPPLDFPDNGADMQGPPLTLYIIYIVYI